MRQAVDATGRGFDGRHRRLRRHRRAPARRAPRRGHLQPSCPGRRQHGRLRHHRRVGRPRLRAALDPQRRRRRPRRPHPHRRRHRARQPLHRRHHPHPAGLGPLHRRAATRLRGRARGGRRGVRRSCAPASRSARSTRPRCRSSPSAPPSGASCPVSAGGVARARPPVPPPLHGARHEPPPRHRRARLRRRPSRPLPRRRPRARHGVHDRARACTSSPTTSPCPRSSAASGSASRTTSW